MACCCLFDSTIAVAASTAAMSTDDLIADQQPPLPKPVAEIYTDASNPFFQTPLSPEAW